MKRKRKAGKDKHHRFLIFFIPFITVILLFSLFSIFLSGYELRKLNDDEQLIRSILADPDKYVGKEVNLTGIVFFTQNIEWVRLGNCNNIYIKKSTSAQTYEYNTEYYVKGIVKNGETPFGNITYILDTERLKKVR